MSKAAVGGKGSALLPAQDSPKPEEIHRQLQAILTSPVFHGSKRCQQFLEYVCEKSLAREAGALKERTIAIEVFGRQPESDLAEDTIVRVGAREVRKRLAQYYVTPDGAASEIRIELPSGSYAPEFRYNTASPVEAPPAPAPVKLAPVPARRISHPRLLLVSVSAVVLLVGMVAAVKLPGANANATQFQRFWDPVFRAQEPLLVAVAHPIVYHPSAKALHLSEQSLPAQDIPFQRPLHVPANELNGADIIPVFNQYVGFGDMIAATEVASMLGRNSKDVRVRMASNVEFADLRRTPALLIGAVTNRWTLELQQSWRFRFNWTPGAATVITDTQAPAGQDSARQWSVRSKDDGSSPDDYILVSRIHSVSTGGLILLAAGLKQFGTEAAGRLLADPDQLGIILRKLPPGWENKSVQLVLHARVIGNTPAQPELLASHVW